MSSLASRKVLIVGKGNAFSTAVSRAFSEERLEVVAAPTNSASIVGEDDLPFYAVVLISPVLVHDYGDARPRRFSVGIDPFGAADPRKETHRVRADGHLGTDESQRFVEAVATAGTRVAMVNASLLLDPNPRGELDGLFASFEVPLLLHKQLTVLDAPLARAIPQIWSVDALPSGRRDGWGSSGFSALHTPRHPFDRSDQLLESARDLVESLTRLRHVEGVLQSGDDIPF
jgi:hypothetical protein